jgi:hypothetical protein
MEMTMRFDAEVLQSEVGVRAIWLLYKRGAWGKLEDFGIKRSETEPLLVKFENEYIPGERLSMPQVHRLMKLVPGLEEAGREMRLSYALQYVKGKLDV